MDRTVLTFGKLIIRTNHLCTQWQWDAVGLQGPTVACA